MSKLSPAAQAALQAALTTLEARFLFSLTLEEMQEPGRLGYQLDKAGWYYIDFLYPANSSILPFYKDSEVRELLFKFSKLFNSQEYASFDNDYSNYKQYITTCGTVPLNSDCTKVLLCKTLQGDTWMFPRGKIDEAEPLLQAAIRETEEETGVNMEANINPNDYIIQKFHKRYVCLFIAQNISDMQVFSPQCRGEVSEIRFHDLDNLPKHSFQVKEFIPQIKSWIASHHEKRQQSSPRGFAESEHHIMMQTTKMNRSKSIDPLAAMKHREKNREDDKKVSGFLLDNKQFNERNDETFSGEKRSNWSVDEMFAKYTAQTGKNLTYDGNPHDFGNQHPKYVNYSKVQSQQTTPADFSDLSAQSMHFDSLKKVENAGNVVKRTNLDPMIGDNKDKVTTMLESMRNNGTNTPANTTNNSNNNSNHNGSVEVATSVSPKRGPTRIDIGKILPGVSTETSNNGEVTTIDGGMSGHQSVGLVAAPVAVVATPKNNQKAFLLSLVQGKPMPPVEQSTTVTAHPLPPPPPPLSPSSSPQQVSAAEEKSGKTQISLQSLFASATKPSQMNNVLQQQNGNELTHPLTRSAPALSSPNPMKFVNHNKLT